MPYDRQEHEQGQGQDRFPEGRQGGSEYGSSGYEAPVQGERGSSYGLSDLETIFRSGQCRNWEDCIRWLETQGEGGTELSRGGISAMTEDLRKLKEQGTQFISDPRQICEMLDHCETETRS